MKGKHVDTLIEICREKYDKNGQAAVEEYIRSNHPDVEWCYCPACKSKEPVEVVSSDEVVCLVCGSFGTMASVERMREIRRALDEIHRVCNTSGLSIEYNDYSDSFEIWWDEALDIEDLMRYDPSMGVNFSDK